MKLGLVLFHLISLTCFGQVAVHPTHDRIFPNPTFIEYGQGNLQLPAVVSVSENEVSKALYDLLTFAFPDRKIEYTQSDKSLIHFQYNANYSKEQYALKLTSQQEIWIEYHNVQGARFALQSLRQLIHGDVLEFLTIEDKPAFSYRGVHLDCSRHFFTISDIKQFLDEMAYLKFNTFHWHLTDDQGWRIEIKKFPKLTEIGAWRDSTLIGHYRDQPWKFDRKRYGGFYTQEQAKEIIAYAGALGIEVIPEIELPGHARAALAAYPELSCTEKFMPVASVWGVFDEVFCTKDETLNFLKDVLTEVAAIFPSKYIHIGGDEVPKVNWEHCSRCQAKKAALGLKNEHELQSYVIQEMEKHLNSIGKSIIGWDEILEGGLAPNATVMSWRGMEGGQAAAALGHPVIMTPTTYCYFDYYQSAHPDEPTAIGGFLPLSKVYSFKPTEGVASDKQHLILGGQANLWSEYLVDFNRVQYHAFPRLAAMAEVLWNRSNVSYDEFVNSLVTYYVPHLQAKSINFSNAYLDPQLKFQAIETGLSIQINHALPDVKIYANGALSNKLVLHQTPEKNPFKLQVSSELGQAKRELNYAFTTHSALGIPVTFKTPPHPKYNTNGELGLTDGVIGEKPWKGNEWLGFEEDTVEFIMELDKQKQIKSIELYLLHDPASWIYQPQEVQFEFIAKNGDKHIIILKKSADYYALKKIKRVKSIRVRVINQAQIPAGNPGAGFTPWTFISELVITE